MRLWRLLLVLLFASGAEFARATTVVLERVVCPACEHDFVGSAFGSWFQRGDPNPDLTNSLFSASHRFESCPYCLYSTLRDDFDTKLAKNRRGEIRAALAREPIDLKPLPEAALKAVRAKPDVAASAVEFRLAQLCAPEPGDAIKQIERALAAYYSRGDLPGLSEEGRTLYVETASRAFAEDSVAAKHPVLFYLLGEFQRQAGQTEQAVVTFSRVLKLGLELRDEYLATWAKAQSKLAQAGNTKIVSREKGENAEDTRNGVLKKKLPEFLAALKRGRPSREWSLPAGKDVPAKFRLSTTLGAACSLAKEGHSPACEYIVGVLAQGDASELEEWFISQGIEALAHHPELAAEAVKNAKFRVAVVGEAARYAVQGGAVPALTTGFLAEKQKWSPAVSAVLRAARVRGDVSIKPAIFARLGGKRAYEFLSDSRWYLSELGAPEDLPQLVKLAERTSLRRQEEGWDPGWSERGEFEDAMRSIRLRAVIRDLARAR